jgi:hypothetical protein
MTAANYALVTLLNSRIGVGAQICPDLRRGAGSDQITEADKGARRA